MAIAFIYIGNLNDILYYLGFPISNSDDMELLIVIMAILSFLLFLTARGVFKGKKWALYLYIGFKIHGLSIDLASENFDTYSIVGISIGLVWTVFVAYTVMICQKHPFYNQKKSLSSDGETENDS